MNQRPQRGDRVTKNGIQVVVRLVENGEVYGERWLAAANPENSARFRFDWPFTKNVEGYLGDFRISLLDWLLAIYGAEYERAA